MRQTVGMLGRQKAEEGMEGGQPNVAGGHGRVPRRFEVSQEE
jgi:hypothetical protein